MNRYKDGDKAAHQFAKEVFDIWGIGDPRSNNGLLIFISTIDRKFRIITGKGAMEYVSNDDSDSIFEDVKPYFKSGNYADGIKKALEDIEYYINPPGTLTKIYNFIVGTLIVLMIPMIFCTIFICCIVISVNSPINKKRADFTKNIEKLKNLQKDGKLIINSACGICLLEFEKADTQNAKAAEYVILVCGHNFHKDCLETWLKKKNMCPFCKLNDPTNPNRDNINSDEYEKLNQDMNNINYNNNNDFLQRMIFIQRNRYPEFYNDYSFDYGNNSFNYRDLRENRNSTHESGFSSFSGFAGGSSDGGGGGGGSW